MLKYKSSLKHASSYAPIFGGNWNNTSNAGLLTVNYNSWASYNTNYGLRDLDTMNPQRMKSDVRDVLNYSLKAIKSIAPFLFSSANENQLRSVL